MIITYLETTTGVMPDATRDEFLIHVNASTIVFAETTKETNYVKSTTIIILKL